MAIRGRHTSNIYMCVATVRNARIKIIIYVKNKCKKEEVHVRNTHIRADDLSKPHSLMSDPT